MRAAVVGRVDRVDVAGRDAALVLADDRLDRAIHRAQMHRHMRRVGDQRAFRREHGAGEVEPLLDVHRIGGVLQRHAHLLGDRHEQIVEHFEHDRVSLRADRMRALERHDAREHEVVLRGDFRLPAGLDHDGLMRLDDDRRAGDLLPGLDLLARIDRRVVPFALREEPRAPGRRGQPFARARACALLELRAAADRFDRDGLHDELLVAIDESEPRLMRALERGLHFFEVRERDACAGELARVHDERGVCARITDMRAHDHLDLRGRHTLALDLVARGLAEQLRRPLDRGSRFGAERQFDRLFARGANIGEAHAVSRQQRRERMDQHARHAERIGDEAGMLPAGTAEAVECVARHVVAALHGNLLDGVRHVLDRDFHEAVGDFLGRLADLLREIVECVPHGGIVEGFVLLRPKDFREELRHQLAEHDVRVGDGERPAAAVAFRTRIGAGGVGAHAEARAVEMQNRAAAGRDGMDQHHRRAHAHARDFRLEGAFVIAVEMRHVGRGSAHVEADQSLKAGLAAGFRHSDNAACGARQDRILALKQLGGRQSARGHHEHQSGAARILRDGAARLLRMRAESSLILRSAEGASRRMRRACKQRGNALDIPAQDRREIRIDHSRVAAADQFDQRRHLVAHRHLRKTHVAREGGDLLLVLGIAIGVHQHDRDRIDAVALRRLELAAHRVEIERALDRAVGAHALVDFGDALVEHVGFDDVPRKNFRPRLIADLQRVAEAARDQEQHAIALALQQRIGRDGRAHLHRADLAGRDRLAALQVQQIADPLHGGVSVGFRILRQQLVRDQ
jgi:hypothetical protein